MAGLSLENDPMIFKCFQEAEKKSCRCGGILFHSQRYQGMDQPNFDKILPDLEDSFTERSIVPSKICEKIPKIVILLRELYTEASNRRNSIGLVFGRAASYNSD
jgi:hypothetical protein